MCDVCLGWGGRLKGAATVAKCSLFPPTPTPTHSQSLKSRDVRASRNLRDHFVSERTRFIDEETEAQCFYALPNLAELVLFMYCHQGLVPALILHLAA